jgi:hypothetical protein
MYRNSYLCSNQHNYGDGIVLTHSWEAFGDKDAQCGCPRCGNICSPVLSEWAEHNAGYFKIMGYGFCMVLSAGHADPLKTLDENQLEALLELLMLGSFGKVAPDEHLLGHWGLGGKENFTCDEQEYRMTAAAALVYLSGNLAKDIPFLQSERQALPQSDHERVYTPKKMELAAAMQQAKDQIRAALDNLVDTQTDAFTLARVASQLLGHGHPATMDLEMNIPPDQD